MAEVNLRLDLLRSLPLQPPLSHSFFSFCPQTNKSQVQSNTMADRSFPPFLSSIKTSLCFVAATSLKSSSVAAPHNHRGTALLPFFCGTSTHGEPAAELGRRRRGMGEGGRGRVSLLEAQHQSKRKNKVAK
jgi:hypothetical protein